MKMNKKNFLKILFILFAFSSVAYGQLKDYQIYFKAKKQIQRREYEKAAETFKVLKSTYPNSRFNVGAEFYNAYMLDKQEKNSDAFKAYENFVKKYPTSGWVDDAEMYQIGIAERFIKKGNQEYNNFIVNKLNSQNKHVKFQAAVSLGRLRDRRALPVLKQMEEQMEANGDIDMGNVAKSLIRNVEKKPISISPRLRAQPDKTKQPGDIQSKRKTIRQPGRRTLQTKPGYQKQPARSRSNSPKVNRPKRGSQTKSRPPAVKTKPSTTRSGTKKSSPPKKK
jgi:tetratricopeptide (TPR) repeat protein